MPQTASYNSEPVKSYAILCVFNLGGPLLGHVLECFENFRVGDTTFNRERPQEVWAENRKKFFGLHMDLQ